MLPKPEPVQLEQFHVLPGPKGSGLFTISASDYQALMGDVTKLLKWAGSADWLLDYYAGMHDGETLPEVDHGTAN